MIEPITRYVLGFAFLTSGVFVVLIKKNRPDNQARMYNGVGGKIEEGESPEQAMAREFFEETSVSTAPADWKLYAEISGPGYHVFTYSAFLPPSLIDQAKTVTDEEVLTTGTAHALKSLPLLANLRWLIPAALDTRRTDFLITVTYKE